eukprot:CAMPEP_0119072170 /NCGR_PEP_ID=MMETSP1178-20130426/58194_1 /TAXON_ID=33656 /ORGANISM="unid sp, Strain CCMP2000" /LENGTH=96 /DNA_ID=CAMNT_0007054157 /DNA_START=141 /DNA_END=429 /DNA_ORIENTATION=-
MSIGLSNVLGIVAGGRRAGVTAPSLPRTSSNAVSRWAQLTKLPSVTTPQLDATKASVALPWPILGSQPPSRRRPPSMNRDPHPATPRTSSRCPSSP